MHHWREVTTSPPESSDETGDTSSQMSLIIKKLTLLETSPCHSRLQANPREGQTYVSFTDAPASAGAIAIALNCQPSVGPAMPKRPACDQSIVTPCLPKHEGSACLVHAQTPKAHSQLFYTSRPMAAILNAGRPIQPQYLSDLEEEQVSERGEHPGNSTEMHPLPDHYFHPEHITTPEQVSNSLLRAQEGAYFVIMQGSEPGVYNNWHKTAAIAENVGGVWTKVYSKDEAIRTYRDAYVNGFCKHIYA